MSGSNPSKSARDNHANQLNPTHSAYHRSRGLSPSEAVKAVTQTKATRDNRASQLNPNNAAHEKSRGVGGESGLSSNLSSAKAE